MYSRWFNVAVVILWLSTMSWLVKDKVLPLLQEGEPPRMSELVASQLNAPPVGWNISIGGRRVGWALTETKRQEFGLRDIRGRVHFDDFPLNEAIPGWLQPMAKLLGRSIDDLQIDARSVLSVDSLGHLVCFESSLQLDRSGQLIGMRGTVDEGMLNIKLRAGGLSIEREYPYPANALPNDFFSPQATLPGLYEGRKWTVRVYSPLMPSKDPIKIIHAKVERTETITHDGKLEDVWLVVYTNDTGGKSDDERNQLGKLWVRTDGTVVKQESCLSNTTVAFERMTDERAKELAKSAGSEWWQPDTRAWTDGNHD